MCSATLVDPSSLPSGVPSPHFQWSFNGSASLPSGVTAMPNVMNTSNSSGSTYSSILRIHMSTWGGKIGQQYYGYCEWYIVAV